MQKLTYFYILTIKLGIKNKKYHDYLEITLKYVKGVYTENYKIF